MQLVSRSNPTTILVPTPTLRASSVSYDGQRYPTTNSRRTDCRANKVVRKHVMVRSHNGKGNFRVPVQGLEHDDAFFMREALQEAKKAALLGEVPVGAVLVSQGRIVARAHNRVESAGDATAHAEMLCIRIAASKLGGWRLLDSTLYVTLEPCPMCAGALLQARVGTLVWGARNMLLGADGSWVSLLPISGDEDEAAEEKKLTSRGPIHPFNPHIQVRRGVLASDCSDIMRSFFKKRRKVNLTRQSAFTHLKNRIFTHILSLLG